MGYVGTAPLSGDYRKLDDISGTFDGDETEFALTVSTVAVTPPKETTLLISVGGILQEPVSAYTLSGSTITFTAAPELGADFFGVMLGDTLSIGTPSDGTISAAKVEDTFISGQTEITSGLAAADELLYSDGGTIKKVGLDTLADKLAGTNITASAGVLAAADTNTTYTATANGGVGLSGTAFSLDVDGMTDIGAGVVSGDLLIIDDSGDGTNRKTTVDRIATLFAGTNLTASSGVISVDDSFLVNSGNDTTAGTITAAGFTTGNDGVLNFSDDLPSTDRTATGVTVTITSSTTLVKGVPVCITGDGTVAAADASAVGTMPAIGINTTDLSGGAGEAEILLLGIWHDEAYNFTADGRDVFIGLDPASSTAASDVLGITTTAPSATGETVQKVGVVLTPNTVFVNFTGTEVLLA
jgi:hypothetical protein